MSTSAARNEYTCAVWYVSHFSLGYELYEMKPLRRGPPFT